jgi:penicillin-binding protein 1C
LSIRLPRGVDPNLSIILGGGGARLEDLAGAYVALNRGGIAGRLRYTSADPVVDRRVLSDGAAWIVRAILEANPRPGYPGSRPRVAWKTGTSYGYRDAWAMGTTRGYTVGVWIGRPDGTPLPGQYGAVTALPLMFQAIDGLPRNALAATPEAPPRSVTQADICWPLGLAFDPAHAATCQQKRNAWVLNGVVPPTLPERDATVWSAGLVQVRVDVRGRRVSPGCMASDAKTLDVARWPALAYPWLSPDLRRASSVPPLQSGCAADGLDASQPIRIDGVADGAAIARAPNSDKPASLRLRVLGADRQPILWLVNGKLEGETRAAQPFEHAFANTGEQTITALAAGGAYAQLRIRVLR